MNTILKTVLCNLRNGLLDKAYDNKAYINDMALSIYNKSNLTQDDIEDLKDIILIGNITYNDTDRELLPLDDSFYDVLLEKYKKYDPNFQVGAEVIDFKSSNKSIEGAITQKSFVDAVTFGELPTLDDMPFRDDIIIDPTRFIDQRDFTNISTPVSEDYIGKRHHDTSHEHPELVGTLDKAKFVLSKDAAARGVENDSNVSILERDFFANHIMRGIITPDQIFDLVLELKYDGISVEADCTDEVISARSRGDTGSDKAADLTPILRGYKFPHRPIGAKMIGVKFEAIITKNDLPYFNKAKGYEYKNCRSAIVGLMSSSDAWKYRDFITLVPLAVEKDVYENECQSNRIKEIEFLNQNFVSKGCPLRYAVVSGNYITNLAWVNIFTQNAEGSRDWIPFMYDGIVVSYVDENIRKKLGRENFINKYSMAVKFNPMKKQTIFRGYSYTVGQDGSITPMIHYDPVEFYGTVHPKSSGHSYARFQELDLHKGDLISVEYVNDVMPYVNKIFCDYNIDNDQVNPPEVFPTRCPICGGEVVISDSGKSAKCINPDCGGRQLSRMVNMFAKLGLDGFGEATIAQLGYYHLADMMKDLNVKDQSVCIPKLEAKGFGPVESINIMNQLLALITNPLPDSALLGAIGFTGISTKTFELILPKINYQKLRELFNAIDPEGNYAKRAVEYMSSIKGIGPATADTIAREFHFFQKDIDWMFKNANITVYVPPVGKKVVLSGTRDRNLIDFLNSHGFVADPNASLTRDTDILVVPDGSYSSSKTSNAAKWNIPIVTVMDITSNVDKYL